MACMETQSRTQDLIPGCALFINNCCKKKPNCFGPKLDPNVQITVKIVLYSGTVLYGRLRNLDRTVRGNYGPESNLTA